MTHNVEVTKNDFNYATVEAIAKSSDVSMQIFKHLSERKKVRKEINLGNLILTLLSQGKRFDLDSFYKTWKEMESKGLGTLVYGRNGKSDRFLVNYNLKLLGEAGVHGKPVEAPTVVPVKSKLRGRPKGSKNKNFDRSQFMAKLWAKRKRNGIKIKGIGQPKKKVVLIKQTSNDRVVKLLEQVLNQLKSA